MVYGSMLIFSYSCKVICFRDLTKNSYKIEQSSHRESNYDRFFVITFFSKSSFIFDPFLIQSQIGSTQVVLHSLYQKFLILFSLTPNALVPLFMVESNKNRNSKRSSQAEIYLIAVTSFLAILLLVFANSIIGVLSSGKFAPDYYLVTLVITQGFIGSIITRSIQSANTDSQLNSRLRIAVVGTIVSVLITYSMLPIIGIAASFTTSTLYSIILYAFLRANDKSDYF